MDSLKSIAMYVYPYEKRHHVVFTYEASFHYSQRVVCLHIQEQGGGLRETKPKFTWILQGMRMHYCKRRILLSEINYQKNGGNDFFFNFLVNRIQQMEKTFHFGYCRLAPGRPIFNQ